MELNKIENCNYLEAIKFLENITGNVSLSIFFGRSLEDVRLHGKPLANVLKETQLASLKTFSDPLFILSGYFHELIKVGR